MRKIYSDIDRKIIAEVKNGSTQAFQQLFEQYGQKIYNFSLGYLKNKHDAEEIVQEVFLKIWKIREDLSDHFSFNSFVFTIAKNAILNTIRKEKYKQAYVGYSKLNPEKDILLDEELDFRELERLYRKSIDNLSPKRREVYLLG